MSRQQATPASSPLSADRASGLWRDALLRLRSNPGAMVGALVVVGFAVIAVLAGVIAPHGPTERIGDLASVPPGPTADHLFGLDTQGRDYLSRIVFGTRLSLLVGLVSVLIGLTIGVIMGSLAGYVGGRLDTFIMRFMDLLLAFPAFLLAVGLVTVLGQGLLQIMIAVGIVQIPIFARLSRGSVLAQRESDYVLAARSLGTPSRGILLGHILPNAITPVIVQATLSMGTAIIEVAGLSFVGLGPADPGLPEWGRMLSEAANRLQSAPHLALFPGFAIVVLVMGINLLGDGMREALDPRLKP